MKYLFLAFLLVGCTDAQRSKVFSLGSEAFITCYSGNSLIYEGTSTGKVSNSENSDGYYFRDAKTDSLMEVSGNCVVVYK